MAAKKKAMTTKRKLPSKVFCTVDADGEPSGAWSKQATAKSRLAPGEVVAGPYVLAERKRH